MKEKIFLFLKQLFCWHRFTLNANKMGILTKIDENLSFKEKTFYICHKCKKEKTDIKKMYFPLESIREKALLFLKQLFCIHKYEKTGETKFFVLYDNGKGQQAGVCLTPFKCPKCGQEKEKGSDLIML